MLALISQHYIFFYKLMLKIIYEIFYFVGEGCPTLISTGITQAGLPVTPTPDPGSSEEKKNPPGTDHVQTNNLFYEIRS